MDSLTAGIGLVATQLCVTLALLGIYFAAPQERFARYWVLAEVFLANGMLLLVLNAGAPHLPFVFIGNVAAVLGAVLQWWGIQAFYGDPPARAGWFISGGFALALLLLLVTDAPVRLRIVLFSCAALSVILLGGSALYRYTRRQRSFGVRLLLGAMGALGVNNLARIIFGFSAAGNLGPATHSPFGVMVLYIVPQVGILAYAIGLVLLCFERIVKEKHHLATHDELTGLLNRRAIVAAGERELELALREKLPLSVAMADIDFFKRINDELGHGSGDLVLADIARLLTVACRRVDLVGRYGGEEFCLVLPGANEASAAIVGERLVAAARKYRFHRDHPVTLSIGLATLAPGRKPASWAELIQRADGALYEAKRLGRNRFRSAGAAAQPVVSDSLL